MKKTTIATLAVLALVLGTVALARPANALWESNPSGQHVMTDNANG